MADEDEQRALEEQLEIQLQDQRDSLNALNDALASDPSNPELLAVSFSSPFLLLLQKTRVSKLFGINLGFFFGDVMHVLYLELGCT